MRHISNGEYMHFFRSLRTVVPRLRRVHASYLKWRPVSRYKSLLFCKLRNPNEKDMAEYNWRSDRPRINYKALLEPKLPKLTASTGGRASRKIDTQLYPLPSPPPKQGCRRVPKSKQYTIAEVITATSSREPATTKSPSLSNFSLKMTQLNFNQSLSKNDDHSVYACAPRHRVIYFNIPF